MKIKLLKDIPGYKAGEILEGLPSGVLYFTPVYASDKETTRPFSFPVDSLIESGWAEEVKDEHICPFDEFSIYHCSGEKFKELGNLSACEYGTKCIQALEAYYKPVSDEIDIEEIRETFLQKKYNSLHTKGATMEMSGYEADWFTAYRIVKAVIEKLNGDWKPDWSNIDLDKWTIVYNHEDKHFTVNNNQYFECTFWYLKDQDTTKKVISLCEPELKVLFGVK